ncbi:MAG: LuxR C-terminal-related transcriptional regulator [Muribaculaceae bacterium]|nr:LuxR C-terminal-related transcriptional regulator [Muribaculaceae bacterium]
MKELIRENNLILMVIGRFDIPFGFGDETVGEVCNQNNVDADTFLAVCNLLSGYQVDIEKISLDALISYLTNAHTTFMSITFPKIRQNLLNAINYSSGDSVAFLLIKFFDDYVEEVRRHLDYENNVIFQYVKNISAGKTDTEFSFSEFSSHHEPTVAKLNELKDIFIYHYKQKDNAKLCSVLYEIIVCEKDMMSHFEVENNLLIPAVEKLERRVRLLQASDFKEEEIEKNRENNRVDSLLGEREKDIIRCVAYGKSNKEIAEELCISVHTVATHRKNISSKLGIHSTAGLTIFAIINHLVELDHIKSIVEV